MPQAAAFVYVDAMNIGGLAALLQQADAQGSRSSILKGLLWLLGIEFFGLVGLARAEKPVEWVMVVVTVMLFLTLALLGFTYVWALIKNPDLLRSERYAIKKLQIQYADNLRGVLPTGETSTLIKAGTPKPQLDSPKGEES